jgi:hypothetical protein
MIYYKDTDLAIDDDGDLILDVISDPVTGEIIETDFALAKDFDCTADDIDTCAKSQKNDSDVWPNFGADLEELVGQPNTRQIGEEGRDRLVNSLIDSGIVNMSDLTVMAIPGGDTIIYYVIVQKANGEEEILEYPLSLGG